MEAYFDIAVHGDPEVEQHIVMAMLFAKLHDDFARTKSTTIGLSFPRHDARKRTLGSVLRLHGPSVALEAVRSATWQAGFSLNTDLGDLCATPSSSRHQRVRRVQVKSGVDRLIRRAMARKGLTEQQARLAYETATPKSLDLPFVRVLSRSTSQDFNLFIEHVEVPGPQSGTFNAYGLSTTATLPLL